jgi:hypothetical protein
MLLTLALPFNSKQGTHTRRVAYVKAVSGRYCNPSMVGSLTMTSCRRSAGAAVANRRVMLTRLVPNDGQRNQCYLKLVPRAYQAC